MARRPSSLVSSVSAALPSRGPANYIDTTNRSRKTEILHLSQVRSIKMQQSLSVYTYFLPSRVFIYHVGTFYCPAPYNMILNIIIIIS